MPHQRRQHPNEVSVLPVPQPHHDAGIQETDARLFGIHHEHVARMEVAVQQVVVEQHLADRVDPDLRQPQPGGPRRVRFPQKVAHGRTLHEVLHEHVGAHERVARPREVDAVHVREVRTHLLELRRFLPHVHLRRQRASELSRRILKREPPRARPGALCPVCEAPQQLQVRGHALPRRGVHDLDGDPVARDAAARYVPQEPGPVHLGHAAGADGRVVHLQDVPPVGAQRNLERLCGRPPAVRWRAVLQVREAVAERLGEAILARRGPLRQFDRRGARGVRRPEQVPPPHAVEPVPERIHEDERRREHAQP
mmetsp:Transcript_24610/g.73880  ORF Transcript_24610/g.73880 Transcript_24610/m.73880 type:complete len:310 (+) Transcript_24610:491-1420(+)